LCFQTSSIHCASIPAVSIVLPYQQCPLCFHTSGVRGCDPL
jgi:hypothetical protein